MNILAARATLCQRLEENRLNHRTGTELAACQVGFNKLISILIGIHNLLIFIFVI